MPDHPLPLILDFDGSVLKFSSDEIRISLHDWQEQIRFGCTRNWLRCLEEQLKFLPKHDCAFLGSGDYHHLSLLLLEKAAEKNKTFEVVVCDNHPDNMRYPFGVHCGSWVYHASKLPQIEHIHVVGITSDDITARHCWENYLSPLRSGKLSYWSVGKKADWLSLIGAKKAHRDFDTADELIQALTTHVINTSAIYLSIDKDVLVKNMVETNWDQGCFTFEHLGTLISACRDRQIEAAHARNGVEPRKYFRFPYFDKGSDSFPCDPAKLTMRQANQIKNIMLDLRLEVVPPTRAQLRHKNECQKILNQAGYEPCNIRDDVWGSAEELRNDCDVGASIITSDWKLLPRYRKCYGLTVEKLCAKMDEKLQDDGTAIVLTHDYDDYDEAFSDFRKTITFLHSRAIFRRFPCSSLRFRQKLTAVG